MTKINSVRDWATPKEIPRDLDDPKSSKTRDFLCEII